MMSSYLKHSLKRFIVTQVVVMTILVAIAVTLTFANDIIVNFQLKLEVLPKELLIFLGTHNIYAKEPPLLVFYMLLVIVNIIILGIGSYSAVNAVKKDEEDRSISFLINQPYSRNSIATNKLLSAIIISILYWITYIVIILLSIFVMSYITGVEFNSEILNILGVFYKGMALQILLTMIMMICSIDGTTSRSGYFVTYILLGTFTIGNIYKVFDLISFYQRVKMVDASIMEKITEITKMFRWVNSFGILNILVEREKEYITIVTLVSVAIAVILATITFMKYRNREY